MASLKKVSQEASESPGKTRLSVWTSRRVERTGERHSTNFGQSFGEGSDCHWGQEDYPPNFYSRQLIWLVIACAFWCTKAPSVTHLLRALSLSFENYLSPKARYVAHTHTSIPALLTNISLEFFSLCA